MISSLGMCAAFDMEPVHPSLPFVRSYQIQISFYCGINRDAVLLCLQDTFMIWFLNICISFNVSPYVSVCRQVHVVAGVHRGQRCQISQELCTWLEAPDSELDLGGGASGRAERGLCCCDILPALLSTAFQTLKNLPPCRITAMAGTVSRMCLFSVLLSQGRVHCYQKHSLNYVSLM